jgi:hypothetical protein
LCFNVRADARASTSPPWNRRIICLVWEKVTMFRPNLLRVCFGSILLVWFSSQHLMGQEKPHCYKTRKIIALRTIAFTSEMSFRYTCTSIQNYREKLSS